MMHIPYRRDIHFVLIVYLPNCPQALIICLATASLGAIFSSASADFGVLVGKIAKNFFSNE